jgi:hypothetical protein
MADNLMPGAGMFSPEETMRAFRQATLGWDPAVGSHSERLAKENVTTGIPTGAGIYGYPLEKPAKNLYSEWTYFVQHLDRKLSPGGPGGTADHWVQVDGIMSGGWDAGIAEGAVGDYMLAQTSNQSALFKTLGRPGNVTFEAIAAAQGFDDAKALQTIWVLQNLRMSEEVSDLGGCTTGVIKPSALTPTGVTAAGGTLAFGTTYYFAVSAFTLLGSGVLAGNTQVTGAVDSSGNTNAANETDGRTGSGAPGGSFDALRLTWPAVKGAVGYNVFIGTSSTVHFLATVYTNKYTVLTATQTSSHVPNTANQTANALQYDGILYQAANWANPASLTIANGSAFSNFVDMAGSPFTASGFGSVNEIDTALGNLFQALKVGPDLLVVSPAEAIGLRNAILEATAGGSTSGAPGGFRFLQSVGPDGRIVGGTIFANYVNPFLPQQSIDVLVHPYMPPGTAIAMTTKLPAWYPNANISTAWAKGLRRDYYSVDYAVSTYSGRSYPLGVYLEGVMLGYFPGGTIVFSGINS